MRDSRPAHSLSSSIKLALNRTTAAFNGARQIGFLDLTTSMALVMALGFLQNLVLARVLGTQGFGHVSVVNAAIGFGQLFGSMGMTVAVLRHASAQNTEERSWAVYRMALPFVLSSSLVVGVAMVALTYSPLWVFDRVAGDWVPVAAIGIPFSVLFLLNTKYLQSKQRMRDKAVLDFANKGLVFAFVVVGAFAFGFKGFIFGGLAGVTLGAGLSFIRTRQLRPERRVVSPVGRHEMLRFGTWSLFSGIMGYVLTTADVLCVSAVTQDATATGLYGLAVVMHAAAKVPSLAYLDATFPTLVKESLDTGDFGLRRRRMQRNMAALALVTSAGVALISPFVVPWIFGDDYQGSVNPLLILLLSHVFWSLGAVHGRGLLARGHVQGNFWASGIAAVINVGANLLLIPIFGIIGAAIATCVSQILWAGSVTVMGRWLDDRSSSNQ